MSKQIATKAYAVTQLGIIGLPTICYTANEARKHAVYNEREYISDQSETDSQIWRKLYRQGFRVVPVTISIDV